LFFFAFSLVPEGFFSRSADAGRHEIRAAADMQPESAIPAEALRIRILAHSNRAEDQEIKRRVRDRVMALIGSWEPSPKTNEEMRERLKAHLGEIEAAAQAELARWGAAYGARAMYGNVPFPAKTFAGREYPAGEYEGLLITLGDGDGDNWWCVLFPPLCLAGAVAEDEETEHRTAETSANPRAAGPADQTGAEGQAVRPVPKTNASGKAVQPAPKTPASGEVDPAPKRQAFGQAIQPAPKLPAPGKTDSGPKAMAYGKSGSAAEHGKGVMQQNGDAGKTEKPRVKFLLWELLQRLADFLKKLFSS